MEDKLFLDSGAFSLYFREAIKQKKGMEFYDTSEFWSYVDDYALFIKRFSDVTYHYANVDVITDPEGSYKVLKYLEDEHGINPVPVIHCGTSVDWVSRYVEEGYDLIGLGGFVGRSHIESMNWCHDSFDRICDKDGMPRTRVHGFAMTSFKAMVSFPWYSVDSTTWKKAAFFGEIIVPRSRNGFDLTRTPIRLPISQDRPTSFTEDDYEFSNGPKSKRGVHYDRLPRLEQKYVAKWLESLGTTVEAVKCDGVARLTVNLKYFEMLSDSLPEYPWKYKRRVTRKGLFS